jgi:hypothetical protein
MKLTGKAKEHFQLWYLKSIDNDKYVVSGFYNIPDSMQWGVYQDWADSLGYDLSCAEHENAFMFLITHKKGTWIDEFDFKTRQEARNAAIEKLNELINER